MFRKKPVLQFESALEEYPNILVPSKNMIPDWYKKIPKWKNGNVIDNENNIKHTVKHCMPFMDALSNGYMILLPYDLYVKNVDGSPSLLWREAVSSPPSWRPEISNEAVVPSGCYPTEYTWQTNIAFKIPTGYSALLTHPLNRHDLPFVTLSGIIDGGYVNNPHGSIPFYIKSGFEGIIEQGTPIAQMILFKQERWESNKIEGLSKIGRLNNKKTFLVFSGWYKKTYWTRKDYF